MGKGRTGEKIVTPLQYIPISAIKYKKKVYFTCHKRHEGKMLAWVSHLRPYDTQGR